MEAKSVVSSLLSATYHYALCPCDVKTYKSSLCNTTLAEIVCGENCCKLTFL